MAKVWRYMRDRLAFLIVTLLFWLAVFFLLPSMPTGLILFLFILLVVCSFIAVLLLGDSFANNFVAIMLLVSIFFVVLQSFTFVADENYHFLRSFDLTNGRILPIDAGGYVPAGYEVYAARDQWTIVSIFQSPELWFTPVSELIFFPCIGAASYLSLPYVPAALGIGVARLLNMSLAGVVLMGRLTNFLFYVGVCWLTICRTKRLRSLVFLVAASTGAATLLGTIHIDMPLIACSLLFVSICLHYCFDDDAGERVRTSDIVLLVLSGAMVAATKYLVYSPILLIVLFLPRRYQNKKLAVWIVFAMLMLVAAVQAFALLRYPGSTDSNRIGDISIKRQIEWILTHPVQFATVLGRDILGTLFERVFGQHEHGTGAFEAIGVLGALLPMTGALLTQDRPTLDTQSSRRWTAFLLVAALAIQVMCCTALYVGFTNIGAEKIDGIQPRYTMPFLIFVMIPVSMLPVKNEMRNWPRLIGFLSLLVACNYIAGLLGALI